MLWSSVCLRPIWFKTDLSKTWRNKYSNNNHGWIQVGDWGNCPP